VGAALGTLLRGLLRRTLGSTAAGPGCSSARSLPQRQERYTRAGPSGLGTWLTFNVGPARDEEGRWRGRARMVLLEQRFLRGRRPV
jgi:hypothetical protein